MRSVALGLAMMVASVTASAQDEAGGRRLTVGGFGTLGVVYHNEEGIEYRRTLQQGKGAPAGELFVGVDTLAGVQVNAAWNANLEAVVQGVIKYDKAGEWQPRVTRAFVRYRPTQEFMLRLGRIGYEQVPGTTSRDIGYSYLGIREPVEVFGLPLRDDFDGGDIKLTYAVGEALVGFNLFGGYTPGLGTDSPDNLDSASGDTGDDDHSAVWGAAVDAQARGLLVRIGAGVMLLENAPPIGPLADALRQVGTPESIAYADDLDEKGRRFDFAVIAAQYDRGPFQSRLSLVRTWAESAPLGGFDLALISGGYRLGPVTPFVSLSSVNVRAPIRGTGLPDTPENAEFNDIVYSVQNAGHFEQSTFSAGLRYDFAPKMDLKFQIDRVHLHDSHVLIGEKPGRGETLDMTVFGVALDFVF